MLGTYEEPGITIELQGFAALPAPMRGTDMVALLPSGLRHNLMRGLATCAPPFELPPPIFYMVWHRRDQHGALHQWIRTLVRAAADPQSAGDRSPRRPGA